ncbi:MAG: tetratricopeptide repeat protein [Phycisphaerales bacterium]|nr:tetratricopeptide repeat protein [Phycisphaerales bacterium]
MTLSRHHQHDMANYLFAQGQHTEALGAYERLAEAYPKDAHAPSVRLMVALIAADYLNDPVRAKQALVGLEPQLTEDHERELARRLLADLA